MTTASLTNTADVLALRAPEGCVAYLVSDRATREALVVDPRLDQVELILASAAGSQLRIRAVIDTHTHADHLSGARRLASRAGAELLAPSGSKLRALARRVEPGASFRVGGLEVQVLAAPGHTSDAVALLVDGRLLTGDALFLDGIGRTDFPGGSAEDALRTLETFAALPPETVVLPGHDYAERGQATLGALLREHPVLSEPDPAVRLARVSGAGAEIPDIRDLLAWNLLEVEPQELPPRAVHDLLRGGTIALIDVRSAAEVAQARIPGATNVPLAELEARISELPAAELVLTCRTGVRARSARDLLLRHDRRASLLAGSLEGWRKAGLPLLGARPGRISIDRQVQLIVGLSVLASVLAGALLTPWALILAGLFGAGLAFAGASGTCGLALVLARAPWNRAATPTPAGAAPVCSAGSGPAPTCAAGGRG